MRLESEVVFDAVFTSACDLYPTFTPAVTPNAPPPLHLLARLNVGSIHPWKTYTETSAECSERELSAIASATDVLFSETLM
jgi:hypothetical protein